MQESLSERTDLRRAGSSADSAMPAICAVVAIVFISLTLAANKHWHTSENLWANAIEHSPSKARPYNNLGDTYVKGSQYAKGEEELRKAYALLPSNAKISYNLGMLLHRQGKIEEAVKLYETTLLNKPDFTDASNNLGIAYATLGRHDDAMEMFLLTIKNNPEQQSAYSNLGALYILLSRYDDAVSVLTKATSLNPKDGNAHNNLGNAYYRKGMYEEALLEYYTALTLDPSLSEPYRNIERIKARVPAANNK